MQLQKFYALLFACLLVSTLGYAQKRAGRKSWYVNPSVGASNYVGDFTGAETKGFPDDQIESLSFTSYGLQINAGYQFHPKLSVRANLAYGNFNGSDAEGGRRNANRNVQFETNAIEFGVQLVYDFIGNTRYVRWRSKLQPYLFAGIAGVAANSEVTRADPALPIPPPASFEQFNQIVDGNNIGFAIPFGAGIRYKLTDGLDLTLEHGVRYTFMDNFDGMEDFVNEKTDWYSLTTIGVRFVWDSSNPERCIRPRTKPKKKFLFF